MKPRFPLFRPQRIHWIDAGRTHSECKCLAGKMTPTDSTIEILQRRTCEGFEAEFVASHGDSKLGFAISTVGKVPINGLRHPPSGDTNGWYLWCGTELSEATDFFAPLCARHVYDDHPEIAPYLGLPPGYRFLIDGAYVDVWYDPALLNV